MIKYLVMDVDGSLTDGKIYMGQNGEVMKAFSVKDGYVFSYILKPLGIKPIIITARNSSIVQNRCDELGISDVYQGKLDKLSVLNELVGSDSLGACAYFGDDILDLKCMLPIKEAGGIIACPSDAVNEVRAVANYVCVNKAGDGALREFCEWVARTDRNFVEIKNKVSDALDYLLGLEVTASDVGKHIVSPTFYYCIQNYATKPECECKLESHRKYVDIQIIVKGVEAMDIADISRLSLSEPYDVEKDVMFWNTPERMARTVLNTGDYIILYPENAHRGAIKVADGQTVLKIVGKVQI